MAAPVRILQLLAQRPGRTGSGVTIDSLAREQVAAGHDVHMVVGVPSNEPLPEPPAGLHLDRVHPLTFGPGGDLPFPVVGMSDVMPYRSTVWSSLSDARWRDYGDAWRAHLRRVLDLVKPDVVHAHHVWYLASLVKDVAPDVPLVVHCHATGLRQMRLCPDRAPEVVAGVRRADAFAVLHDAHREELSTVLDVSGDLVHIVGAGFDQTAFHDVGAAPRPDSLGFVGKLACSKGVAQLLGATEQLAQRRPNLSQWLAAEGTGPEADMLAARVQELPFVEQLGRLTPSALGDVLRRTHTFVLPSYYEGLPLVLAEARACGCRVVATALPGVRTLAAPFGDGLTVVDLPRLRTVDEPEPDDVPAFVARLRDAIEHSLNQPALPVDPDQLAPLTWRAVAQRVDRVYRRLPGLEDTEFSQA